MKLMEVLGDALVREEQIAEIPIIDPKVLERAKSKYQNSTMNFQS